MLTFSLMNCGGAGSVEKTMSEAQNQAQYAVQGAIEFVTKRTIKPFLSDNPVTPDHGEFGFTPKYIPFRIAVDTNGNILISSSSSIVTDIGVFDVVASKKVITQEDGNLLIIQIDEQVAIYKLPSPNSNEIFEVDFSDKYAKYRILSFKQEMNGNITLRLETSEFK